MYYYKKLLVIRNPINPDRFVIGYQAGTEMLCTMMNDRIVFRQSLVIPGSSNPWGLAGEVKEVILDYFENHKTHEKYSYQDNYSLLPVFKTRKPASITRNRWAEVPSTELYIPDIIEDVKKGLSAPVSIDDSECFINNQDDMTWLEWNKKNPTLSHPLSSYYFFLSEDDYKLINSPYYVIKDSEGFYLTGTKSKTDDFSKAKQFSEEQKAYAYVIKRPNLFTEGFEVEEEYPCPIPNLRIR